MFGPTFTTPSSISSAGNPVEQREVGVLAQRQHQRVGLELLELAGGLGEAGLVELHLLDHQLALVGVLDRGEPLHHHALLLGLLDLEVVRGHPLTRAPVDDDRLGRAEALGGPRHVHRGVAAAVHDHAPPQHRLLLSLHASQHRDGVEDVRRLAGGDVGALADVRPDRQEGCVKFALPHRLEDVGDLAVQLQGHAHVEDALSLGLEHVPRQPVLGDPEVHHAADHRAGVVDRHGMAETGQVVGGREPGGASTDDQHPLPRALPGHVHGPAVLDRLVAEEALHRVDPDRLVELAAVAGGLAGVVTDAPHDRRERVVLHDLAPSPLVALGTLLGLIQPALDVFAGRAGVVAGRQAMRVDGALGPP